MNIRLLNISVLVFVITNCLIAQFATNNSYATEPNFRIYPSTITQTEIFVTRHPDNSNLLLSSANTINLATGFISEGIYVSHDGGILWSGTDTCNGSPILFHRGDPGITIDKNGTMILTRLGFQDGLFAHFSTDNGLTWSSQRTIATERQDRASLVSDGNPTSAFFGRSYTGYVELLPPFPVKISFTDDGGKIWSTPAPINNPLQRSQGTELKMGNNSDLYALWAAVQSVSPFTEDFIGFAHSTNGGESWTVNEQAIDMNGIQGTLPQKFSIRVNGLPKMDVDKTDGIRHGWIYIVTTQKNLSPSGNDPDIVFYRSTNKGQTWSQGIRVNQDALNNGKIQYFPAIHVDDSGGLNVLYYDDRNTTSDSAGVMLSRSADGGDTWSDYPISDHNFQPKSIGGLGQGYQGDNISLTSVVSTLIPMWMDNSSGIYQIWSARVPISTLTSVKDELGKPSEYRLMQNYPNPFNPSTTILYALSEPARVSLAIYDILGREIEVFLEGEKNTGEHRIDYTSETKMSSGVYFYQLRAGSHVVTKKMILQK